MSDSNSKTRVPGLFARARPAAVAAPRAEAVSEHEHDDAIVQALAGTRALRDDLARWREAAEKSAGEMAHYRQEGELLRARLSDVTAKMEYHQRWNLELVTKCNDLEMFVHAEMGRMVDVINGQAETAVGAVSSGARASVAAVNAGAATIKRFLDDLHSKRQGGEYRPKGAAPALAAPVSEEEEGRLRELAASLAPAAEPSGDIADLPPQTRQ